MRVLLTGDRGFLGRHFKTEMLRRGWEVTGLDTAVTPSQDCRLYFRAAVSGVIKPEPWDLVVHCAAVVGGRMTIERSPLETASSLSIDAEMFRWAAAVKPGRVLYISSSAAYPVSYQRVAGPAGYRLHEDDVWNGELIEPDEVYGWSKVTGELLAGKLRQAGVPVTVVRPFSGYGADQDPSYPFRAIMDRIKAQEDPLEVWCAPCTRDWIHVDDVVNGALAVAADGTPEPVNLCTGIGTSFRELITMGCKEAQWWPEAFNERDDMPQGVRYRVGNPARMKTIYEPRVTLADGIRRALAGD